jgi:hypothetical protein
MPLKPKNPQPHSNPPPLKNELSGPWGRINPEAQIVGTLRLCKRMAALKEETYSYPYRVLASWRWRGSGRDEELEIEAGSDLILIRGRGLDRVVEALDRNALEILRENPATGVVEPYDQIQIEEITVGRGD